MIRNRLVPVGDLMFRNFAYMTANPWRRYRPCKNMQSGCRGFCDEGLMVIEYMREVVGI